MVRRLVQVVGQDLPAHGGNLDIQSPADFPQLRKWLGGWYASLVKTFPLMAKISTFNLQQIFRTFRADGARDGFPRWDNFRTSTLHPQKRDKNGNVVGYYTSWNIRYGTNMKGASPRRMAGAKVRRYSPRSKLLRASGGFRNSFRAISTTEKRSVVGSTMTHAAQIIRGRPVIRISNKDRSHFARLMLQQFLPKPMGT